MAEEFKIGTYEIMLVQANEKVIRHHDMLNDSKIENFNLFQILIQNDERRNSLFIAELLNPNGAHNKGSAFLELFVQQIEKKLPSNRKLDINYCDSCVQIEKYIGSEKEESQKGYIDIFIDDNFGNCIVIENKFEAKDQDEQLFKYNEFCINEKFSQHIILYLTYEGRKATKESEKGLISGNDYYCISYQDHIIKWLNDCISIVKCDNKLNDTLKSYKYYLLKKVEEFKIMEELKPLIQQNLLGAKAITEVYDSILSDISISLKQAVKNQLEKELQKYSHVVITIPENEKLKTREKRFSSIWIDNMGENRIIIESFNTKGLHYKSSLFIGIFHSDGEKWRYEKPEIIRNQQELFEDLSKCGKEIDLNVLNNIVSKIVTYIDKISLNYK